MSSQIKHPTTSAIFMVIASLSNLQASNLPVQPAYEKAQTQNWSCRRCPFDSSGENSVTAGVIVADEPTDRFARDNAIDADGGSADLNIEYTHRTTDGHLLEAAGTNLGLDSRNVALRASKASVYEVGLDWQEIPRNTASDGRTPYSGNSSLTLPGAWVAAPVTSDMTGLAASSQTFDHATRRENGNVEAAVDVARTWRVAASYSRETKRGANDTSADFFFQAASLRKPIDYTTDNFVADLSHSGRNYLLATQYRRSEFDNQHDALQWQNAFSGGVESGRKALAPDNTADAVSVMSRFDVGTRTTVNATLAWGRNEQNDRLLPYTTSTDLVLDPLPVTAANREVETFAGTLNIVSRLTDAVRLTIKHTERERDDVGPIVALTPVLGDIVVTGPRDSRAYSFDRSKSEVSLQYRLSNAVKLVGGYVHDDTSRTNLEIANNEEDRFWLALKTNAGGFGFRLRFDDAKRDASEFQDITNNNPLTRRFHFAARDQQFWQADFDYSLDSINLTVGASAQWRENSYDESVLGLLNDEDRSIGMNLGFVPTDWLIVSASFQRQKTTSITAGSSTFSDPDWVYGTADRVETRSLSIDLPALFTDSFDLSATYLESDGTGNYDTTFEPNVSVFPQLVSGHTGIEVEASYRWNERVTLIGRYYYEDYSSADWAIDGLSQDGISNVITLGYLSPDYSVSLLSLSLSVRL